MWSFIISLIALVLGYLIYGRFIERLFGSDPSRPTPVATKADGVDYVPMPAWKVYMIQFLNIAGTGPIFGAIMGAKFGPSCYLWIVFGSIFAGAVHDYFSGMLSIRHGGAVLPAIVGEYLGEGARKGMLVFTVILSLLLGAVFVYSPALILGGVAGLTPDKDTSVLLWGIIIFLYYIVATLLPIDKLIGRFYPFFAASMLFMCVSLAVCLFIKWPSIPELWQGLGNRGPSVGLEGQRIIPCLFITLACGALSGFHSTQCPLMARCIQNERMGRPIFYGAMITEGCVALVWAAVASYFFFDGGAAQLGAPLSSQAPEVVTSVSRGWLGVFGGILALIGVVAAPITSGDTAFRSVRLIISDRIGLSQKPLRNRLVVALPCFVAALFLIWYNVSNPDGFNVIWRYFGLANQSLACFVLWTIAAYISRRFKGIQYMLTLLPAVIMTFICILFLCTDRIGFRLPYMWGVGIAIAFVTVLCTFFAYKEKRGLFYIRRSQGLSA